eukprot:SAG22_NODE_1885_length_3376_cov_1.712542_2_plen_231_part_00
MLAPLEPDVRLSLALGALYPQRNLLRGLGLLVENRLGLATVASLLAIVPPLTCREENARGDQLGRMVAGLLLGMLSVRLHGNRHPAPAAARKRQPEPPRPQCTETALTLCEDRRLARLVLRHLLLGVLLALLAEGVPDLGNVHLQARGNECKGPGQRLPAGPGGGRGFRWRDAAARRRAAGGGRAAAHHLGPACRGQPRSLGARQGGAAGRASLVSGVYTLWRCTSESTL